MMSDTLYVVLHAPLDDKLLQFHLFRIHNIQLIYPTLQISFQYTIQEEYLAIIMAWQVSNGQFCHINPPCI